MSAHSASGFHFETRPINLNEGILSQRNHLQMKRLRIEGKLVKPSRLS